MNGHRHLSLIALIALSSLLLIACQPENNGSPDAEEQTKALAAQSLSSIENVEAQLKTLEDARYQAALQLDEINNSLQTLHTEIGELRRKLKMPPAEQTVEEPAVGLSTPMNVALIVIVMLAFAIFWKIKTNRQSEAELEVTPASPAGQSTGTNPPPQSAKKE